MYLANSLTFWMFAVDALLSLGAALYSMKSLNQDWVKDSCYLWGNCPGRGFDETLTMPDATTTGFLTFWTHVLIFTNLIPISLLVTIDMVKLGQAKMMQFDLDMFHEMIDHTGQKHELPFEVKRSELNEVSKVERPSSASSALLLHKFIYKMYIIVFPISLSNSGYYPTITKT